MALCGSDISDSVELDEESSLPGSTECVVCNDLAQTSCPKECGNR